MAQSVLAEHLGLSDEDLDEMMLDPSDLQENTGHSGEVVYELFFYVPEETPKRILLQKSWEVGQCIRVPPWIFDTHDDSEE